MSLKKSTKKGMAQSQVIMYIFGVIIVGSILIFGFKSISSFKSQGDNIQLIQFKETISKSIKKISEEYNSVEPIKLIGPGSKYTQLCFYSSMPEADSAGDLLLKEDRFLLVKDTVGVSKENAYLMSRNGLEESFYVGNINAVGGFMCVESKSNRYEFVLTGKGNIAEITLE